MDLDFHFLQTGCCCCWPPDELVALSHWTLWANEYLRALEYDDQSGVELHRPLRKVSSDNEPLLLLLNGVMLLTIGGFRFDFLNGVGHSLRGSSDS
jgi:hypothetical protein